MTSICFDKVDFTNEISGLGSYDSDRWERVAVKYREISPFDHFITLLEEVEVSSDGI